MKLDEIEVGGRYALHSDTKTDRHKTFFGHDLREIGGEFEPATVSQVVRQRGGGSQGRSVEVEVVAVRVPYKNGRHGVQVRLVFERERGRCVCGSCGFEHSVEVDDPVGTSVEFTVHYSQVESVADVVEHELWREAVRRKYQDRADRDVS